MIRRLAAVFLILASIGSSTEPNRETKRWWQHVKELAGDDMEGRDTGSKGHERAEQYVIRQLTLAGLEGAGSEGFLQRMPMEYVQLDTQSSSVEILLGGKRKELHWLRDITPANVHPGMPAAIRGDLYFAGNGATLRPEDVRGKIVLTLSPPRFSSGSPLVSADALASAAAVLAIDSPGGPEPPRWPAAYAVSYRLIEESRAPLKGPTVFRVNRESADVLFAGAPQTLAQIQEIRAAGRTAPNFSLSGELSMKLKLDTETLSASNLVAALPGSDPALKDEYVVLSAHLDGYGRGEPWNGDNIYNGAFDNAAYVATLIDLAQSLGENGIRLKRSLLLCVITGEEKGLLGSKFFALHPTVPKKQLVADLNLDQLRPIFPLKILTVLALNESTLGAQARQVAGTMGIRVQSDPEPERGLLRRSDHYSFMQIGVPALNFVFGYEKGTEDEAIYRAWYAERYHSPADDLKQPWVPEAAAKFNQFYGALVRTVADAPQRPQWSRGSKFAGHGIAAP